MNCLGYGCHRICNIYFSIIAIATDMGNYKTDIAQNRNRKSNRIFQTTYCRLLTQKKQTSANIQQDRKATVLESIFNNY